MRINVYNEELTERIEVVQKRAANTKAAFYGLHFYLHSPKQLHSGKDDDDQSAVILWKKSPQQLLVLLAKATTAVQEYIDKEST